MCRSPVTAQGCRDLEKRRIGKSCLPCSAIDDVVPCGATANDGAEGTGSRLFGEGEATARDGFPKWGRVYHNRFRRFPVDSRGYFPAGQVQRLAN